MTDNPDPESNQTFAQKDLVPSPQLEPSTEATPEPPDDAGPHAAALQKILVRIPARWGRWIDVEAGWYPLVITTDSGLAEIDADYVVHQIKEKYGTLRYYCAPSSEGPSGEIRDAFRAVIRDAERASAITCEPCGAPGTLHNKGPWVKTLCESCAEILGYTSRSTASAAEPNATGAGAGSERDGRHQR